MPDDSPQLVPAVDRAIRMLAALRGVSEGKGISDLARDLAIPKSSAFQIAATMVHHGLLERDGTTRRYRLGRALDALAGGAGARADVSALAVPHLRGLARHTGLTALLGLYTSSGTVLGAKADSPEPLGIGAPVGFELERWAGAFGKIYAAALDEPRRRRLLRRRLPAYTARSIVAPAAMERELEGVRRRGVAIDDEEYLDGIRAVAAPVHDGSGALVGSLCVLGLAARLDDGRMAGAADRARAAAAALSLDLGAGAPEEVA